MPCRTLNQYEGEGPIHRHHCTSCGKQVTERCLKQGHVAYCEVEDCNRIFNVVSPTGCMRHKYRDGFNAKHKRNPPDEQTAQEKEQERIDAEAAEAERLLQEEVARRAEVDYNKDWKKEDRKKMDKVPKMSKKEKKKKNKKAGKGSDLQV
ncbi:hypothetical protein PMIN01_12971 [Paraphaeosphaeria minitans]|uniref:Uncharacterized protein n=1 Tax=Paraphaeosphaeria minitans TaxID=565426 RepID=A0A9P6KK65_9PLEO|nr:hypothetical protein PMIN01_12971 [Paraphaeosphaeria minitans]